MGTKVHFSQRRRSKQALFARGFTLVEVLVSLVIFAFGLLGAAGLQVAALKSSQQANYQAVASSAVREFSDLMLAYPDSVFSTLVTSQTSLASGATVTNPYHNINYSSSEIAALSSAPTASKCFKAECNTAGKPGELGEAAIRDWLNRLNAALPQVKVRVCLDSTPIDGDGVYRWECDAKGKLTAIKLRWALKESSSVSGDTSAGLYGKRADTTSESERAPMVVVQVMGTIEDTFNDL
jgi:type IV pilus assembly protein PilV